MTVKRCVTFLLVEFIKKKPRDSTLQMIKGHWVASLELTATHKEDVQNIEYRIFNTIMRVTTAPRLNQEA